MGITRKGSIYKKTKIENKTDSFGFPKKKKKKKEREREREMSNVWGICSIKALPTDEEHRDSEREREREREFVLCLCLWGLMQQRGRAHNRRSRSFTRSRVAIEIS